MIKKILDLLFPPRCAVCDSVLPILPEGLKSRICPGCQKELHYVKEPFCMKCGKPLHSESGEYCDDCRKRKHFFSSGRSLFIYQGRIKESMYRFKYAGRREYAVFFAEEALKMRSSWIRSVSPDLIVPVPLHPSRRRKRGYNQAEDFAGELSRLSGIPVDRFLVQRIKRTRPMKGLTEDQRRENVKCAFSALPNRYPRKKRPLRILLVDDIYTTGSTADAVCSAIRQEYCAEFFFLSICIGKSI